MDDSRHMGRGRMADRGRSGLDIGPSSVGVGLVDDVDPTGPGLGLAGGGTRDEDDRSDCLCVVNNDDVLRVGGGRLSRPGMDDGLSILGWGHDGDLARAAGGDGGPSICGGGRGCLVDRGPGLHARGILGEGRGLGGVGKLRPRGPDHGRGVQAGGSVSEAGVLCESSSVGRLGGFMHELVAAGHLDGSDGADGDDEWRWLHHDV